MAASFLFEQKLHPNLKRGAFGCGNERLSSSRERQLERDARLFGNSQNMGRMLG
jgi:hypothetical protein